MQSAGVPAEDPFEWGTDAPTFHAQMLYRQIPQTVFLPLQRENNIKFQKICGLLQILTNIASLFSEHDDEEDKHSR